MKKLAILCLGAALMPAAFANLLINGDFESFSKGAADQTGAGWWGYNAGNTGINSWTVGMTSVDVTEEPNYPSNSPEHAVDLAGTPGPGSISQSISTTAGWLYRVSVFARWANNNSITNRTFDMSFAGTTNQYVTTDSYVEYSFTVVGTGGVEEFKLASLIDNTSNGNLLVDDASIQVVPEPASLAVLGLGALAAIRRRRAK